jgi:hypothetical protein
MNWLDETYRIVVMGLFVAGLVYSVSQVLGGGLG